MPDRMRLGAARARELISSWEGSRVVVIGDLMLDRYLWGTVGRISPEAPVPVVDVERESFRLGGAANVANNVAALGARPVLIGVTGEDAAAGWLTGELTRAGVAAESLVADPGRPTTVKTRIVARSHHLVRFDEESRREIGGATAATVVDRALTALKDARAVVVSDYGKGMVTPVLLRALIERAVELGVPVCVDPKDVHFDAYRGAAVVTPNQYEAAEVLGYKLRDDDAVSRAGRDILARLEAAAVLITRGAEGMSLFRAGGERTDFRAVARQVYDVTGAGDTVVATYAAALAGGADPGEAAELSNRAAGDVVQHVGTATPSPEALVADPEAGR